MTRQERFLSVKKQPPLIRKGIAMKRFLAFVVIATLGILLSRSGLLPSHPFQFVLSPLVPLLVSLLLLAGVPVNQPFHLRHCVVPLSLARKTFR
jgi:hypothetical protein